MDEISMTNQELLDTVEEINRKADIKQKDRFFGGKSVLNFGDLRQLPAILKGYDESGLYPELNPVRNSKLFTHPNFHVFFLTQNVRQKENTSYQDLLNRISNGLEISYEQKEKLRSQIIKDENVES